MKLAISGKGGVGKTTLTALLAQYYADQGKDVFAVDGDIKLGFLIANILTNLIMGLFMVAIVFKSRRNLWEQILLGK